MYKRVTLKPTEYVVRYTIAVHNKSFIQMLYTLNTGHFVDRY